MKWRDVLIVDHEFVCCLPSIKLPYHTAGPGASKFLILYH